MRAAHEHPSPRVVRSITLLLACLVAALPARAERLDDAAGGAARGSGLQITPDGERTLINKDVGAERWAITRNDDGTVTGNVFFSDGRDPIFLFCTETGETDDDLMLDCDWANRCVETPCRKEAWTFLAAPTVPLSFFEPPAAPVASSSDFELAASELAPREGALGLSARGSGVQITPDGERTLINKDVGTERWAITRSDDGTVTGNVFFSDGRDPVFLFCTETRVVGGDLTLRCETADRCTAAPCSDDAWSFFADATVPLSFFEPPPPIPLPTGPLGRRRFSIDPAKSYVRTYTSVAEPAQVDGVEGWLDLEVGEIDGATGFGLVTLVGASPVIAVEGFTPGAGPTVICMTPLPGQFPIQNAGVIDCNGGSDLGYALETNHNIGVVGVNGFTAADCTAAGGTVEGPTAAHPGVCNGRFTTHQLGEINGPGGLIMAPNLIGPGGAFNVRITTETALPCGDEGVPAYDAAIALATARTTTTIFNERNFSGAKLETSTRGEEFSCTDWTKENGPGALTFTGYSFDYQLIGLPGFFFDTISVFYLED